MSAESEPMVVERNEPRSRYEVRTDGLLAVLTYARAGEVITFLHTRVPEPLEGRGIASQLAHTALEDARAAQLQVVAQCLYVAAYVRRHRLLPEHAIHLCHALLQLALCGQDG